MLKFLSGSHKTRNNYNLNKLSKVNKYTNKNFNFINKLGNNNTKKPGLLKKKEQFNLIIQMIIITMMQILVIYIISNIYIHNLFIKMIQF